MKRIIIFACLLAVVLSGCSLLPAQYSAIEEGAAQIAVQSSERTICRDLPIGAWIKLYGASASRLNGWQEICFNPVTTPLNDQTMSELLKIYPKFANNPPADTTTPATQVTPPTSATQVVTPAVVTPAAPAVPASKKAASAAPKPAPRAPAPASVAPAPVAPTVAPPAPPALNLPSAMPGQ